MEAIQAGNHKWRPFRFGVLGGKFVAALEAAAGEYIATSFGGHALQEAVLLSAMAFLGL